MSSESLLKYCFSVAQSLLALPRRLASSFCPRSSFIHFSPSSSRYCLTFFIPCLGFRQRMLPGFVWQCSFLLLVSASAVNLRLSFIFRPVWPPVFCGILISLLVVVFLPSDWILNQLDLFTNFLVLYFSTWKWFVPYLISITKRHIHLDVSLCPCIESPWS